MNEISQLGPDQAEDKKAEVSLLYTDAYLNFFSDNTAQRNLNDEHSFLKNLLAFFETTGSNQFELSIESIKGIVKSLSDAHLDSVYLRPLISYHLLLDISHARTSHEVLKAIDAATLPPGGAFYDRTHMFTVSVQSYPGIAVDANHILPDLPLGLAFNRAIGNRDNRRNDMIIGYAQFLNLANPFSYRLSSSTEKKMDRLRFSALFDPGLALGFGFKTFPMDLMAGYFYNIQPDGRRKWNWQFSVNLELTVTGLVVIH